MFKKFVGWTAATICVLYVLGALQSFPSAPKTGLRIPRASGKAIASQQDQDITLINVLNAPRTAGPVTIPPPSNYASYCIDQWTKRGVTDQSMVSYCVQKERDGYDKIGGAVAKYSGLFWLQGVLDKAEQMWTKAGVRQDSMVAYELEKQIDAFLDLQYALRQTDFKQQVGTICLVKWTKGGVPDWNMIQYCYKQETGRT